jgi:hypothetical protein
MSLDFSMQTKGTKRKVAIKKRFLVGTLKIYTFKNKYANANAMIFYLKKLTLTRYEPHRNDHEIEPDALICIWVRDIQLYSTDYLLSKGYTIKPTIS